ncbi:MAG TPA: ABC transporter permease [Anaerolineaceae bacterium]|nr:ABC transporter permease [Anaerolineaceae bacterium]
MASPEVLAEPAGLQPELVIRPSKGWVSLNLKDLWRYRELVFFLTWRDISVRYKQTVLGAAWAILQPFFTMVVFSVFFGLLAKVPSDGLPYPVWNFCALVPWQLFAYSLAESGNSLVANQNLITKVYFPRVVIPIAATLGGLVDFAIAFVFLIGMMLFYHITPTSAIWTLPLFVLLAILTALGAGLWLSALNVEYRDVRYMITFLIQFWMFLTPIAYPSSIVPARFRVLYGLNPMAGVVEGFRWALLGNGQAPGLMTAVSVAIAIVLFFSGLAYFRRMERSFADKV